MLVGEELTLVALVAATLMVDIFTVAGCVASVDFRNTPAAVAAMGSISSNDMPLGYRPPVRLTVGASSEGPSELSSSAAWHFARPIFGGPRLASARFFTMVSCLQLSILRLPSIVKCSPCSSALPLAGKRAPEDGFCGTAAKSRIEQPVGLSSCHWPSRAEQGRALAP
ncbi:hypothetical protein MRX96_011213 [Rhipicephalus microplus]